MKYEDCEKCPNYLCRDFNNGKHQGLSWVNHIIHGNNFYITPPCTYGISVNKFRLIVHNKSPFEVRDYNFSTLEDCIEYMLLYKDLQLEDALRLTRIKNEL